MANEGFSLYLKDISSIPRMPWDEQKKLFWEYRKSKDPALRERLTNANLPLVVKLAKDYSARDRRFRMEDLISVGNMGLLRAIDEFDPSKGFMFSTYAYNWILEYMRRYALSQSPVSPGVMASVKKMEEASDALHRKLGYYPSDDELLKALGPSFSLDRIQKLRGFVSQALSLDAPVDEEGRETPYDQTPSEEESPDQFASQALASEELEEAMETLTDQERAVIRMRNGLNSDEKVYTLRQVGDLYGVSKQRIKQIEQGALKKLRAYFEGGSEDGHVKGEVKSKAPDQGRRRPGEKGKG